MEQDDAELLTEQAQLFGSYLGKAALKFCTDNDIKDQRAFMWALAFLVVKNNASVDFMMGLPKAERHRTLDGINKLVDLIKEGDKARA